MSELTIGQAAEVLGVSARTLRHWEDIGLLVPSYRSWADYRLYTEEDLEAALEILVYRETGMPLKDIAEIVSGAPSRDRLIKQQEHLARQIARLRQMHGAVTAMLEKEMTMQEKIEAMGDWNQYADEAEQRWGDTPEWQQAQRKHQSMSQGDWAAAKVEMEAFTAALVDAHSQGIQPGSEAARELVLRHRAQISQWYECTPHKQVCLARMYVADERFHQAYAGKQDYLLELVEAQAKQEGVDLEDVQWR